MINWKSKQLSHEGVPLLLRYPEGLHADSDKTLLPVLAVVTHAFLNASPNGLPEPDYNDSLIIFDRDIRATFENGGIGHTVLIETFGGKRKYYIYVAQGLDLAGKIASLSKSYPQERLSLSVHPDAEWGFIKKYAKEFLDT